jgi:Predicted transcriptional regulators
VGDVRAAELARLAGHVADPTRAAFLLALLDGRAWTVTELATHAGVAVSTATEHLNRLREAGLVAERRQGRHRYVYIADADVAHLVEDLAARLGPPPPARGGLRAVTAHEALVRARTCYDHLAGRLGVAIADALTERGYVDQRAGLALTANGAAFLADRLGVDPQALVRGAGRSSGRAWTGPSAAPIWPAWSGRRSAGLSCAAGGSSGSVPAARSASPRRDAGR